MQQVLLGWIKKLERQQNPMLGKKERKEGRKEEGRKEGRKRKKRKMTVSQQLEVCYRRLEVSLRGIAHIQYI